jgi:hypothetical protein
LFLPFSVELKTESKQLDYKNDKHKPKIKTKTAPEFTKRHMLPLKRPATEYLAETQLKGSFTKPGC